MALSLYYIVVVVVVVSVVSNRHAETWGENLPGPHHRQGLLHTIDRSVVHAVGYLA